MPLFWATGAFGGLPCSGNRTLGAATTPSSLAPQWHPFGGPSSPSRCSRPPWWPGNTGTRGRRLSSPRDSRGSATAGPGRAARPLAANAVGGVWGQGGETSGGVRRAGQGVGGRRCTAKRGDSGASLLLLGEEPAVAVVDAKRQEPWQGLVPM